MLRYEIKREDRLGRAKLRPFGLHQLRVEQSRKIATNETMWLRVSVQNF